MPTRLPSPMLSTLLALATAAAPRPAPAAGFERVVIDDNFPGAYQVEVADVNGDGRPDVVAVGGGTCAWYENPSWRKRLVSTPKTTPGIISSATADLDGDGKAEVAIAYEFAMNEPTRGKLLLAGQGKTADDPWTFTRLADVGSIHRLRWGDLNGDKRPELVVAPIFGPTAAPPSYNQSPAQVRVFIPPKGDPKAGKWDSVPFGERPVLHAIEVRDFDGKGVSQVLTADNLGVGLLLPLFGGRDGAIDLVAGAKGEPPRRGSSEVHAGRLRDGRRFLATVEPWHGTEVAVYVSEAPRRDGQSPPLGPRSVIDATLKEGHALWTADVDGDGDDEVFAGYRGPGTSVLMYDFNGKTWDRTVIDRGVAAQDLRGGDLDADGTPDVVAVGGSTHNVVWYRFRTSPRATRGPGRGPAQPALPGSSPSSR